MNEILFVVTMIESFVGTLVAYKFFGKTGLYVWIGFATIIANLEVAKCVDMFGMSVTLGNVIYGSIFLCTDIISEMYGGKEARRGVLIGFFALVVFVIMSQTTLMFEPNSSDFISGAMEQVFGLMPRICIASMVTYLITNTLDTYTYDWIRKKFPDKLWLRNNGSTMTSQLLDSFLFTFLAFAGQFDTRTLIEVSLTTYAIKLIIAVADTPFIYLAKRMADSHDKQIVAQEEDDIGE